MVANCRTPKSPRVCAVDGNIRSILVLCSLLYSLLLQNIHRKYRRYCSVLARPQVVMFSDRYGTITDDQKHLPTAKSAITRV